MAVGVDIGTHLLVSSKKNNEDIEYKKVVDAFFSIEANDQTLDMLKMLSVPYIEKADKIYVLGDSARKFAVMFNKNTRRPLQIGCLNKEDTEALSMLTALMENLLGDGGGQPLVYSCTSQPLGTEMNFSYHKAQIEYILKELNYDPKPIQEARAVALSELAEEKFTGCCISCGAGSTTIWLGLFGMDNPNFQFSINRGGDFVDASAADNFANLTQTKVQQVKEKGIKILEKQDTDGLEGVALVEAQAKQALSIYYREYIRAVIKGIKYKLEKEQVPEFEGPIPIVIAGGTSSPDDFIEVFREEWELANIPLEVSKIRRADDHFMSVARGCLIAAQLQESKKDA